MSQSRAVVWMVWLIASIFYAYQYILRVMPNIMMHDILNQFNIDTAVFGQFSGIYYIGYSLMHLPLGIMLDKYGPKKVMPICIAMTVMGLLPIVFSTFYGHLIIGRALIGMGSSAAILGVFKIIRLNFSEKKFTRMLSISVTIGLIGAIYGGGPVNYMCSVLDYKTVVLIFGFIGLILALATYIMVPDIESNANISITIHLKEVFSNYKVISVCFLAGLMVGPLEGFSDVWGKAFLKQVYNMEDSMASTVPSAMFIGMCFGAPLLSLIAEKTKSYIGAVIIAAIVMCISFVGLIYCNFTIQLMTILFLIVGVACSYQIIAIYKVSTYVSEQATGLATAVANMIIMVFGYGFHVTIGSIVKASGGDGKDAFINGILVIPVALAVAIIGFIIFACYESMVKKNT